MEVLKQNLRTHSTQHKVTIVHSFKKNPENTFLKMNDKKKIRVSTHEPKMQPGSMEMCTCKDKVLKSIYFVGIGPI